MAPIGWSGVSGRVVDVEGGFTENGTRIIQWDWHGGANQRFQIHALGRGYYRVTTQHSGRVLDVAGISSDNGAQIVQWDWWGGGNQQWIFIAIRSCQFHKT